MKDFVRAVWRVETWEVDYTFTASYLGQTFTDARTFRLLAVPLTSRNDEQEAGRGAGFYLNGSFEEYIGAGLGYTGGPGVTYSADATMFASGLNPGADRRTGGHVVSNDESGALRFSPYFRFSLSYSDENEFGNFAGLGVVSSDTVPNDGILAGYGTFVTPKGNRYRFPLLGSRSGKYQVAPGATVSASLEVRPATYFAHAKVDGSDPRFDVRTGEQLDTWSGSTEPSLEADGTILGTEFSFPIVDGNTRNFIA